LVENVKCRAALVNAALLKARRGARTRAREIQNARQFAFLQPGAMRSCAKRHEYRAAQRLRERVAIHYFAHTDPAAQACTTPDSREKSMNLLVRINLALAVIFVLGALTTGFACRAVLQANAEREVLAQAGLMMDSALAIRDYTESEILPLLHAQMQSEFLPQSVPFYAATQNFLRLHRTYPQYAYKEATLNPTNPRDRAADWEADIIQRFRNDASTHEFVGERDTPMGRSLYLARPIRVEAGCLSCHSLPAVAPATVIARYGNSNGFGWQANDVIGAQIVSVPVASAEASARSAFRAFLASLTAVFVALLLVVNAALYLLVVRPVRRMAQIADRLSVGDTTAPEFPVSGGAEVAALGRSFNRMRISLNKAVKLLESRT
jgi:protein-histidine pros-kinase